MNPLDVAQPLLGLGFLIGGPLQLVRLRSTWTRRSRETTGTVTGAVARSSAYHGDAACTVTQHAQVEFEVDGRTWSCVSNYGVSWSTPQPGERRTVVYNPHDPSDSEVFNELGRRIEQGILVALPFVGAALLVSFALRHFA